jgi:hypothetical protein
MTDGGQTMRIAIWPFLLLVALVVAFVVGGRRVRWGIGITMLMVFVLGLLASIGIRTPVAGRSRTRIEPPHMHAARLEDHPADPGLIRPARSHSGDPLERLSDPGLVDQLGADVYPSIQTAAVQCALRLAARYGEVARDEEKVRTIHVSGRMGAAVLAQVEATLQRKYTWLHITTEPAPRGEAPDPRQTRVEAPPSIPPQPGQALTTQDVPAPSDAQPGILSLTLSASPLRDEPGSLETIVRGTLAGNRGRITQQTRASDKLWVEDLAAWKSTLRLSQEESRRQPYIVIISSLAAGRQEVRNEAIRRAAQHVAAFLNSRMAVRGPAATAIPETVEAELRRGTLIRDEFLQRFERPYGTVYRQALLVDVSDDQLNMLTSRAISGASRRAQQMAQDQMHVRRSIASAVGLALLILVVYLFLNAATKGYYLWSLRIAGSVLLVAGVLTVMALA